MNILPIPEGWRERAIVIRKGEIPEAWFSAEELEIANGFARERRRMEWLTSRLAAKRLALDRGIAADPAACRIDQRRIGSWHLSLSHSRAYAAAAIDAAPVGIDIEVARPIDERAAHFFLTDAETEVLRAVTIEDRLIHFWAAKEAAWKQRGGEVKTLKRIALHLEQANETGLRFDLAETARAGELIMALTRSPRSSFAAASSGDRRDHP